MGISLGTQYWGGDDGVYPWVLHSSSGDLATGFPVALGDGTETPLFLNTNQVGIKNAGDHVTLFTCLASVDRTNFIADNDGTLYPEVFTYKSTDSSTSGSGQSSVLTAAVQANSTYEFEAAILVRCDTLTAGLDVRVYGFTEAAMLAWRSAGPGATAGSEIVNYGIGFPASYVGTDIPVINQTFLVTIRGTFQVTGTPSSSISVSFGRDGASGSGTVKMMEGSYIRLRRIAFN